jgi:histidinol phosphatase-like enzyme (inositol monophosphatase family)
MSARLDLALEIAEAAGAVTLEHFLRDDLAIERKQDTSPVTAADKAAEAFLRSRLEKAFPDDGILGEEFPEKRGSSDYVWILDPIDGTKSFIRGVPLYGVLIGIEEAGEPRIGVIHLPALKETVWAEKANGAWWRRAGDPPRRARVSACTRLEDALFCTTTISGFERAGRPDIPATLTKKTRLTRGWGDCYGYALVATGRAEIMIDPAMHPWDAAPMVPILEEAGGRFTDWDGIRTIRGGNAVATNGALHDQVLAVTRRS